MTAGRDRPPRTGPPGPPGHRDRPGRSGRSRRGLGGLPQRVQPAHPCGPTRWPGSSAGSAGTIQAYVSTRPAPEDTRDLFGPVEDGTCELGLTDARHAPQIVRVDRPGIQSLVFTPPPTRQRLLGPAIHRARFSSATPHSLRRPRAPPRRRLLQELGGLFGITPMLAV